MAMQQHGGRAKPATWRDLARRATGAPRDLSQAPVTPTDQPRACAGGRSARRVRPEPPLARRRWFRVSNRSFRCRANRHGRVDGRLLVSTTLLAAAQTGRRRRRAAARWRAGAQGWCSRRRRRHGWHGQRGDGRRRDRISLRRRARHDARRRRGRHDLEQWTVRTGWTGGAGTSRRGGIDRPGRPGRHHDGARLGRQRERVAGAEHATRLGGRRLRPDQPVDLRCRRRGQSRLLGSGAIRGAQRLWQHRHDGSQPDAEHHGRARPARHPERARHQRADPTARLLGKTATKPAAKLRAEFAFPDRFERRFNFLGRGGPGCDLDHPFG